MQSCISTHSKLLKLMFILNKASVTGKEDNVTVFCLSFFETRSHLGMQRRHLRSSKSHNELFHCTSNLKDCLTKLEQFLGMI